MAKKSQHTQDALSGVSDKINGRHAFVSERVLQYIAEETKKNGSVVFEKTALAKRLDCYIRTLDRAIVALRREGLIISEYLYAENGAQMGNSYKATPKGIALAERFSPMRKAGKRGGINLLKEEEEPSV